MAKFNKGDRFFNRKTGEYFILDEYNIEWDTWLVIIPGYDLLGRIYPEELDLLQCFGNKLIKIENDKHLLELQLKYS